MKVKDTHQLELEILPNDASKEVRYESSDNSVAIVDNAGKVTALKAGKTTITVTSVYDKTKTDSMEIEVIDIPESLILNQSSYSMVGGNTFTLTANAKYISGTELPIDGKELTFLSSKPNVASVSSDGVVTAVDLGETEITVSYTYTYEVDGKTYTKTIEAVCKITVTNVPVKSITIPEDHTATPLTIGATYQLRPTVLPANAVEKGLIYKSVDKDVATVSSNGLITAKNIGETNIIITSKENSSISVTFHVKVYQTEFVVTELGANGTDDKTDTKVLKRVLAYADDIAEPITVRVPAGTYIIDSTLIIYSDTNLILDNNAVIMRKDGKGGNHMLQSDVDENVSGYTQCQNVLISGGVWDGNSSGAADSNCIYFGHAQNITIKNTTIKNTSGAHLIELAGVNNAVIDNVSLYGYVMCRQKGYSANQAEKEAIQLDYCSSVSAPAMKPYDNLNCKNVTITNCYIHDYMSGIGSHLGYGYPAENITIANNKFSKITDVCISLKNYRNVMVTGNKMYKSSTFLYANNSTGTIEKNSLKNSSFTKQISTGIISRNGITISNKSDFAITNNLIQSFDSNGICVWASSKATIKDNRIKKNKLYGIRTKSSTISLKKNDFSKNKKGEYDTYKDAKIKSSDDIKSYYISVKKKYKYKGRALKPTIKIKGLKINKNFKVYYKNNKKVGTATITIKGKGKIKGSRKITFKIVK